MTQFIEMIIEMSLFGSVAILAVIILRLLFAKIPRKVTVWFWLVAVFRLLCPVNFSSALSIFNFSKAEDIKNVAQKAPEVVEDLAANNMDINSVLNREYIDYLRKAAKAPSLTTSVVTDVQTQTFAIDIKMILFGIWIIGMVLIALMIIIRSLRLAQRLGIKGIDRSSEVYEVEGITTSFVIGVLDQKICIPENITGFEREYILAHERIHIKNKDQLIKTIMLIILCVHWFNPLVWIMYRLLINDIEMRCDEEVIDLYGEKIKKDYCLSMVLHATEGINHIGVLDSAFAKKTIGGMELNMRIKNLINYKKISAAAATLCLAVTTCGVWAISSNASNDKTENVYNEGLTPVVTLNRKLNNDSLTEADALSVDTKVSEPEPTTAVTDTADEKEFLKAAFKAAMEREKIKKDYTLRLDMKSGEIKSLIKDLEAKEATMENVIKDNDDVLVRSYKDNTYYLPCEYDKAKDLVVNVPDTFLADLANKYNDDDHKIVDFFYSRSPKGSRVRSKPTKVMTDSGDVNNPEQVLPTLTFSVLEKGNDFIRKGITLYRDHFNSAQEFLDLDIGSDSDYCRVFVKETDFGYQKSFYYRDEGYTNYENYYKDIDVVEKIENDYWDPFEVKAGNTTYKADKSISKMNDKLLSEGCEDDWILKCGNHTVCSIYNRNTDSKYWHLNLFSNMSFKDLSDFDKTFATVPSAKVLKNDKQLQAVSTSAFNRTLYFCSSTPAVETADGFKKDYINDEGKIVSSLEYIKSEKMLVLYNYN